MRRRDKRFVLTMLLAGGLTFPSGTGLANESVPPRSPSDDAVLAVEAEVMNAYNSGDPALAASRYAIDAYVFIPGQPAKHGRAAIMANIARFMQDPNFKLEYRNERVTVAASDDLATTRGDLKVTYTDRETRQPRTSASSYLLVLRRDATSGWQVLEDISF